MEQWKKKKKGCRKRGGKGQGLSLLCLCIFLGACLMAGGAHAECGIELLLPRVVQAQDIQATQEWWAQQVERCGQEPGQILYFAKKRAAEEAQGDPDVQITYRGKGFLHFLYVNDGAWPKDCYMAKAEFDEEGTCTLLAYYYAEWAENQEMPTWTMTRMAPYYMAPMYGPGWLSKFTSAELREGAFEYGVFEGTIEDFYKDVVRKIVNAYNAETLSL